MDSTIQKLEAKKPFEINDPVPACGFEVRAAPPDQQNFLFVDHLRYNPSFTFSVALQAVMGYRDWQEERLYAVFSYVRIFSPDRRVSYGTLQLGRDHELFDDIVTEPANWQLKTESNKEPFSKFRVMSLMGHLYPITNDLRQGEMKTIETGSVTKRAQSSDPTYNLSSRVIASCSHS
ncbi:uncharacterized protein KY384_001744 [Bacidia gigantensis]|uniref:uncharacterized protein n=1 Tax=Bacidia gigantensis TaxID=2732470 RepID=UPI001D050DC0|nr:uncharacterized protein KY384_001744 [Bacidia gigantensis]KAG8532963.1 hypothetical protein KY384_001744 [Bacidia gigantensis]